MVLLVSFTMQRGLLWPEAGQVPYHAAGQDTFSGAPVEINTWWMVEVLRDTHLEKFNSAYNLLFSTTDEQTGKLGVPSPEADHFFVLPTSRKRSSSVHNRTSWLISFLWLVSLLGPLYIDMTGGNAELSGCWFEEKNLCWHGRIRCLHVNHLLSS